jgi:predicted Rossmann-fold nucleotide-binding protein
LGRRSTAPLILNLGTVWRKIVSFLDSFIHKEKPKAQNEQEARSPEEVGREVWKSVKDLPSVENRTPERPTRGPVTTMAHEQK